MKKDVDLSYTKWSEVRVAFLKSLRQDETSQHRGIKSWSARLGLMKVSI